MVLTNNVQQVITELSQSDNWHSLTLALDGIKVISDEDKSIIAPILLEYLKNEDWRIRSASAKTFGRCALNSVVRELIQAYEDEQGLKYPPSQNFGGSKQGSRFVEFSILESLYLIQNEKEQKANKFLQKIAKKRDDVAAILKSLAKSDGGTAELLKAPWNSVVHFNTGEHQGWSWSEWEYGIFVSGCLLNTEVNVYSPSHSSLHLSNRNFPNLSFRFAEKEEYLTHRKDSKVFSYGSMPIIA